MSTWVFDIGNSVIKWGRFSPDGQLLARTHHADLSSLTTTLANTRASETADINGIYISSVVPETEAKLLAWLEQHTTAINSANALYILNKTTLIETLKKTTGQLGGLDLSRYQAGPLGADRIADLQGAIITHPGQKRLVVDVGTMTTLDLLDEQNRYLGGAITPGPRKFQSLTASQHAVQLFEIDLFGHVPKTPGLSTTACLEFGLYRGYQGLIANTTLQLLEAAHWPKESTQWILTGGDSLAIAQMLAEACQIKIALEPDLTLQGLYALGSTTRVTKAAKVAL